MWSKWVALLEVASTLKQKTQRWSWFRADSTTTKEETKEEGEEEEEEEEEEQADIKSNNPHLTGGEKQNALQDAATIDEHHTWKILPSQKRSDQRNPQRKEWFHAWNPKGPTCVSGES